MKFSIAAIQNETKRNESNRRRRAFQMIQLVGVEDIAGAAEDTDTYAKFPIKDHWLSLRSDPMNHSHKTIKLIKKKKKSNNRDGSA